jgi:deoxyribodipyrimidine photo-lyase
MTKTISLIDERRWHPRNEKPFGHGPVVYWMQRDQRVVDNWALLYAQAVAHTRSVPLYVMFNLVPVFGQTTARHYDFMLRGLAETECRLRDFGLPFFLTEGTPTEMLPAFVQAHRIGEVVTDQNPLGFANAWRTAVGEKIPVRLTEVDAHNIVPVWSASPKAEFAAYTFRPKITNLLPEFLTEFPKLQKQSKVKLPPATDWTAVRGRVKTDERVPAVTWITPGAAAANKALIRFVIERLRGYATRRNDPNASAQSDLSPYLHFGQLSAQRVALAVRQSKASKVDRDAYLEELIVRRELSDNFCFYTPYYDRLEGAHAWAQQTLAKHRADQREYNYTRDQFENGETHDELWNAMQEQLIQTGKLHGWCRMYWAKKILEWCADPQTAINHALYLNDRYELDGNDPNGVVGVMWSIAGVHDRAWSERPIFGQIRYMNLAGAKRKFDVKAYIQRWSTNASKQLN